MNNDAKISNPAKRRELCEFLRELSDPTEQEAWLDPDYPNDSFGIDSVYHFFFDDTDLGTSAKSQIGHILKNVAEARRIETLCSELGNILDRLGDSGSRAFISDHHWPIVIRYAHDALGEICPDQRLR